MDRIDKMVNILKKRIIKEAVERAEFQQNHVQKDTIVVELAEIKEQLRMLQQTINRKNINNQTIKNYSYVTKNESQVYADKLPNHLDDRQMRLVMNLDNPEDARTIQNRSGGTRSGSKRKSQYDEFYQKSEKRYEELAKSLKIKAKSKIRPLVQGDRSKRRKAPRSNNYNNNSSLSFE